MKPFTFALLQALQRADAALRREAARDNPDLLALGWLAQRRSRLTARLRRSFVAPAMSPLLFGA